LMVFAWASAKVVLAGWVVWVLWVFIGVCD
jgi:hypothetical protein